MNTKTLTRVAYALALGAACGCGGSAAKTANPEARPQRSNRNVLTAEEAMKTGQSNVYLAIQTARPQWLRTRPLGSSGSRERVQVYLGDNHYGEEKSLEQITVSSIKEVRYIESREATTRFGTGHGGGAIIVTLR